MNILIPIAGDSLKLNNNHYMNSLYEISNKTIIEHIYESLNRIPDANFIFVLKKSDVKAYCIDRIVKLIVPNAKIFISCESTQGSACTCLLSIDYIDTEEPLLIAGINQVITRDWSQIVKEYINNDYDGAVVVFDSIHPKWSYVKIGEDNLVMEASEKIPISRFATTGQFYFKKGADFVEAAKKMIIKGITFNEQYYVSPTFNEMILMGKRIGYILIDNNEYFSLRDQHMIDEYECYVKEIKKNENR